jgi:hypothetical protein
MNIRDATANDVDEILAFFARARTEPTGVGTTRHRYRG